MIFNYRNLITHFYNSKSMCNDNNRLTFAKIINRFVDFHLIFRICRTRCFIQY